MVDYSYCWSSYYGETVGEFIEKWAKEMPQKVFLVSKEKRLSWKELHEITNYIAAALLELGHKKGDRLAVLGANDVEAISAWLAATKVGIIPVAISPRYRKQELEYILKDSGASAIVARKCYEGFSLTDLIQELKPGLPFLHHIITYPGEDAPSGMISLEGIIRGIRVDESRLQVNRPNPNDFLFFLYTSGTTGIPKGVIHTHDTMLSCGKVLMEEVWHLSKDDAILLAIPFSHMIGHEMLINTALIIGAKLVLMEAYDPIEFVNTLEREKVTYFGGVPTMFLLPILRVPALKKRDLSSFRMAISCGFYAPPEQMRLIKESYGLHWLFQLLGSTEAGVMTTTRKGDGEEVAYNSLGRPISTITLKILDEQGREVSLGEIGEVCYKSPHLCIGYWNKPDKTAEDFDEDGFWHSGDMGWRIDEEGNIRLAGRKKEIIKRGGFNIHPAEIENFLMDTPKILAAAIVSYPEEVLGERICAFIEPKSGIKIEEREVIELCKGALADYKAPDRVKIESSLPRLSSGKVDKALLREKLFKELGIKESASAPKNKLENRVEGKNC